MYWLMDVSLLDVHTFSTCNDILRPLTPKQKGKCSSEMEAARNSLSAQALWRTLMPAIAHRVPSNKVTCGKYQHYGPTECSLSNHNPEQITALFVQRQDTAGVQAECPIMAHSPKKTREKCGDQTGRIPQSVEHCVD